MLEEQLLKLILLEETDFVGGFGQIAQQKTQGIQVNGGGWGNRFKVRILGYHPYSEVDLPDEDLPGHKFYYLPLMVLVLQIEVNL